MSQYNRKEAIFDRISSSEVSIEVLTMLFKAVLFWAMLTVVFGCTSIEKPQTVTENIAYLEGGAQSALKSIQDLTCTAPVINGECSTPGKPLKLEQGIQALADVTRVRAGLRQAATLGSAGGLCMGEIRSQADCLRLAQSILTQVQVILKASAK